MHSSISELQLKPFRARYDNENRPIRTKQRGARGPAHLLAARQSGRKKSLKIRRPSFPVVSEPKDPGPPRPRASRGICISPRSSFFSRRARNFSCRPSAAPSSFCPSRAQWDRLIYIRRRAQSFSQYSLGPFKKNPIDGRGRSRTLNNDSPRLRARPRERGRTSLFSIGS